MFKRSNVSYNISSELIANELKSKNGPINQISLMIPSRQWYTGYTPAEKTF